MIPRTAMPNEPAPPRPWLTPGQRRLTALAVCTVAGLVLLMVAALGIWGLRLFLAAFGHVIWPLVIAGILAVLLRPVVNSLQQKLKLPRTRAILLLYFLVVAACLALGLLLLPLIVSQLVDLSHTGPEIIKRGILRIKEILREYPDINQAVKSYLDEKGLLNQVNAANAHLLSLLLSAPSTLRMLLDYSAALAVIPIYLFFLLASDRNFSRDFREELTFLPAAVREDIVFLGSEFASIMVSFFHGRLLIGLVMGVLQAAGFFAIGLQGGFILGLFFGILNLVPFLGMILGVAVILPIAYIQNGGGWPLVLEASAVFAVVQVAEAYYFTPKIMGERTGLHPMVILLSIFFWGAALHGLLGIILGVPLTAFLVVAWRLLKTKYLPQHATRPPMRNH